MLRRTRRGSVVPRTTTSAAKGGGGAVGSSKRGAFAFLSGWFPPFDLHIYMLRFVYRTVFFVGRSPGAVFDALPLA